MTDATIPAAVTAGLASADGTHIMYEVMGSGPPLILIGGAFNDRHTPICGVAMARLMADRFTAVAWDRRGRGGSGDSQPYAVEREIEDVAALIEKIGGPAFLFGHSSGAALALEAAAAGLPVRAVAAYEAPYAIDPAGEAASQAFVAELVALLDAGRNDDAAERFMRETGMPDGMIAGVKSSPMWPRLARIAPSLAYDSAVIRHGGDAYPPLARVATIDAPVYAMAGGASPAFMTGAAQQIAGAAQRGTYIEFPGKNHMIEPEAVAPRLKEIFA